MSRKSWILFSFLSVVFTLHCPEFHFCFLPTRFKLSHTQGRKPLCVCVCVCVCACVYVCTCACVSIYFPAFRHRLRVVLYMNSKMQVVFQSLLSLNHLSISPSFLSYSSSFPFLLPSLVFVLSPSAFPCVLVSPFPLHNEGEEHHIHASLADDNGSYSNVSLLMLYFPPTIFLYSLLFTHTLYPSPLPPHTQPTFPS